MSTITINLDEYWSLVQDANAWRTHVAREEARRAQATTAYYAEGAPVAQPREHPASNREDAGSTPVGGASARVAAVVAGFGGADRRMASRNEKF